MEGRKRNVSRERKTATEKKETNGAPQGWDNGGKPGEALIGRRGHRFILPKRKKKREKVKTADEDNLA